MLNRFDANPILSRLMDFQRRTVDYAFERLYGPRNPTTRFLVADEVGLGKTMVAKGLIARAVEHLQSKVRRIDVVYVCSNADIATQNIGRLNVTPENSFMRATRLTLLPMELKSLKDPGINYISFTPGTTFELGSRGGTMPERRLIYQMLTQGNANPRFKIGTCHLLCINANEECWPEYANEHSDTDYDEEIAAEFRTSVLGHPALAQRLRQQAEYFYDRRRSRTREVRAEALALVGDLRKQLARVCLKALQPDLVILDEFQRFRDLLDANNATAELAQALFRMRHVRVLMLSATPYKMYANDDEEEDHFRDFRRTLDFLLNDRSQAQAVLDDLGVLRNGLLSANDELVFARAEAARQRIQTRLLQVMCRTERVGSTHAYDAMVEPRNDEPILAPQDLSDLGFVAAVARELGTPDTLDYWKSSPYLLNFMKSYKLKDGLVAGLEHNANLCNLVRTHADRLLPGQQIRKFAAIDAGNARLREQVTELRESGLWRLLWMPPSLPYWRSRGAYADVRDTTKTLVFSAWNVVPDALAALLSYEAERLALGDRRRNYDELDGLAGRLRRAGDPRAMLTFAFLCPSPALAHCIEPLLLALGTGTLGQVDAGEMVGRAERVIQPLLAGLFDDAQSVGPPDSRWYWVALARVTRESFPSVATWPDHLLELGDMEGSGDVMGWTGNLQRFACAAADSPLGPPPDDVATVLAELALASPGVCALRALKRVAPELAWDDVDLVKAAWNVSIGFLSLFNRPEVAALLSQTSARTYWRRALRYCLDGNLPALLDEQVHVLTESLGVRDDAAAKRVHAIGSEIHAALDTRAASLRPDDIVVDRNAVGIVGSLPMRCRYAARFGKDAEADKAVLRKETVRIAFNSPFWPFVLASTSVGQEGLDFHQWCHSVLHWNLPSNPVDLEQREGRVHRYKGYAVRKNVAKRWGADVPLNLPNGDVWNWMFGAAVDDRGPEVSDLVPYWVMNVEGGTRIRRRFLITPYSREASICDRLQSSLALYRLAFGQPRQEDLLKYLARRYRGAAAESVTRRWRINLEPPRLPLTAERGKDHVSQKTDPGAGSKVAEEL